MTVSATRDEFRRSAQCHVRAAGAALDWDGGQLGSAAYLAHVAMECVLKFRLLASAKKTRTADMKVSLGEKFQQIFQGRSGHDLRLLAEAVSLKRLLAADGKAKVLESADWQRMLNDDRPYALRYGTEKPTKQTAAAEVELARTLIEIVIVASGG